MDIIESHGRTLLRIFPNATKQDPLALCRSLRRIEKQANAKATDYCNGLIDCDEWDAYTEETLAKLRKILGPSPLRAENALSINGDCRGYALKLDDGWTRAFNHRALTPRLHTDWGGYGILAPEIN